MSTRDYVAFQTLCTDRFVVDIVVVYLDDFIDCLFSFERHKCKPYKRSRFNIYTSSRMDAEITTETRLVILK